MSKIEFNGFEIYTIGNAKVSIIDERLRVDGITETGLDGIIINGTDKGDYTINFAEMPQLGNDGGILKVAKLAKNNKGQITTLLESFKAYNEKTKKVNVGYTSSYLTDNARIVGKLKGEKIFDKPLYDVTEKVIGLSTIIGIAGLVLSVISLAYAIWSDLRTKEQQLVLVRKDEKGNAYVEVIAYEDPEPFEVELADGNKYLIDEYGIELRNYCQGVLDDDYIAYIPVGEQITASNIGYFDILSIKKEV